MGARSAILTIKILADATKAAAELDAQARHVGKFEGALSRATGPAKVVAASVGAMAVAAGKAASDLEQSVGAVETVFKDNADTILEWSKTSATAVGLSSNEYNNLASLVGSQLKGMGTSMEDLAPQTDELIKLGADLAATYGGTTADAVAAVSSLLRGERDPIEKYGVAIKATDVAAQRAAMGLADAEGAAAKQADAMATLALLTNQTADASGAFSRESDTAAHAQQVAQAQWANTAATLGQVLLPLMVQLGTILATVGAWAQKNAKLVQVLAAAALGLAGAVLATNAALKAFRAASNIASGIRKTAAAVGRLRDGYKSAAAAQSAFSGKAGTLGGALRKVVDATVAGAKALAQYVANLARAAAAQVVAAAKTVATTVATKAASAATKLWAAAQWVLNAAMSANPVGLIIAGIVALVAVVVILWKKCETFRKIVTAVFQAALRIIRKVWDWVSKNWPMLLAILTGPFGLAVALIIKHRDKILAALRAVWEWIRSTWAKLTSLLVAPYNAAKALVKAAIDAYLDILRGVLTWLRNTWSTLVDLVTAPFETAARLLDTIIGGIGDIFEDVFGAVLDAVNKVIDAIDKVKSAPGKIWDAINPFSVTAPVVPITSARSFAAPTLLGRRGLLSDRPGVTRSTSGQGGLVVNISGAIDPQQTARAIQRLTRNADIRAGRRRFS